MKGHNKETLKNKILIALKGKSSKGIRSYIVEGELDYVTCGEVACKLLPSIAVTLSLCISTIGFDKRLDFKKCLTSLLQSSLYYMNLNQNYHTPEAQNMHLAKLLHSIEKWSYPAIARPVFIYLRLDKESR